MQLVWQQDSFRVRPAPRRANPGKGYNHCVSDPEEGRTALLCGATGLVGSHCLNLLLADPYYKKVVALTRRPLGSVVSNPKLDQRIVDFEQLDQFMKRLRVDHVFSALGTTIAKAGTQEKFRRVDFDYPLAIARAALDAGAQHLVLVSSLGADPEGRVFYLKVKGELEEAISEIGYRGLTYLRPSLLVGERKEPRLAEQFYEVLLKAAPRRYRGVPAETVARVMVESAKAERPGCEILESPEIASFV